MAPMEGQLPAMRKIREAAVLRSKDPLTLQDLRSRPDQVVALVANGRRVEHALYHQSSVCGENGNLRVDFENASPVTGLFVNSFRQVPPLYDLNGFISFMDWDNDGFLSVHDVGTACAAVLPMCVEGIEDWFRTHFDFGEAGTIQRKDLEYELIPHWGEQLHNLHPVAPLKPVPILCHHSTNQDLLQWFHGWAFSHGETFEGDKAYWSDLQLGIAAELYLALGDHVDTGVKELIVATFFEDTHFSDNKRISTEEFLLNIAPSLIANMPNMTDPPPRLGFVRKNEKGLGKDFVMEAPLPIKSAKVLLPGTGRHRIRIQIRVHAPLTGEVMTLREGKELPIGGGTFGELRQLVKEELTIPGEVGMYFNGRVLGHGVMGDLELLSTLTPTNDFVIHILPIDGASSSLSLFPWGCMIA
eukprot:TRINITY_DN76258_c0_g1_i1.p1 TRINITY_DN76258_c0_g1~~TRINITY_DN76258_c0_g1_i1.p1  ORF type:complete len:414 (+),score=62.17 TRINITY_DN76258_c0_g1_i1:86-1327(+)